MNKFKKILIVVISIVAIVVTFAINCFASGIINGQLIQPVANVPYVSNTVYQNFTNDASKTRLFFNSSSSYFPYTTGSSYMSTPSGSIANLARMSTIYLPSADVTHYGFDNNFFNDGVMLNRVYTQHSIDSLCESGKPVVSSYGVEGVPKYIGVSIRAGAVDSPNNNMENEIFYSFDGGFRVTLGVTDLVSGYQSRVTRIFDNSTSRYATSYHYLNPLFVDVLGDSNINNEQYILVLDYVRVEASKRNYLFNEQHYDFFGFEICYTWDTEYSTLTNGFGEAYSNKSIYSPFYLAALYSKQVPYDVGYEAGYNDGFEAVGIFDFIINGVEGFLAAELFPGFSFGLLLMAVAGIGLFIWILKIFAGG